MTVPCEVSQRMLLCLAHAIGHPLLHPLFKVLLKRNKWAAQSCASGLWTRITASVTAQGRYTCLTAAVR
jgi:hypothetical protein